MHQLYRAKCTYVFPGISHRIYMISLVLYLQTIYLYINTKCKTCYTQTKYQLGYSSFALDIYTRLFYRKFHSLLSIQYIWISSWNYDHTQARTISGFRLTVYYLFCVNNTFSLFYGITGIYSILCYLIISFSFV